jgi:hypothetical protein
VLSLSRVTGQDVLGPDGRALGRLADLTVQLGEQAGLTGRATPRARHRGRTCRRRGPRSRASRTPVFWYTAPMTWTSFAITSTTDALGDDEILLVRDARHPDDRRC